MIRIWNEAVVRDNIGVMDSDAKAAHDDLMMRSKILQKYSLASIAGFVICLVGLKYVPSGNPILLIILAVIFAVSAGLKLFFAFKWQREARSLLGQ